MAGGRNGNGTGGKEPVPAAPADLAFLLSRVIASAKPQNTHAAAGMAAGKGMTRDTPRGSRFWFGDPNAADHCRDHGRGLCFLGERDPSHSENNSIRLYRGLPLSPSLSRARAREQGASCTRVAARERPCGSPRMNGR